MKTRSKIPPIPHCTPPFFCLHLCCAATRVPRVPRVRVQANITGLSNLCTELDVGITCMLGIYIHRTSLSFVLTIRQPPKQKQLALGRGVECCLLSVVCWALFVERCLLTTATKRWPCAHIDLDKCLPEKTHYISCFKVPFNILTLSTISFFMNGAKIKKIVPRNDHVKLAAESTLTWNQPAVGSLRGQKYSFYSIRITTIPGTARTIASF